MNDDEASFSGTTKRVGQANSSCRVVPAWLLILLGTVLLLCKLRIWSLRG